jgi:two-component system nitrogen regulation sensor histidine kinase NtrY
MGSSPGATDSSRSKSRNSQRAPFERRVAGFSALLVAPGFLISGILIWLRPWTLESKLMLLAVELLLCLLIGVALRDHIVRPLQTLANVVGALIEEDYSFRARLAIPNDALGELSLEINTLADLLAQQRSGGVEATALLERVVEEVDIPIFAFDPGDQLRLVNSAGGKLLQQSSAQIARQDSFGAGAADFSILRKSDPRPAPFQHGGAVAGATEFVSSTRSATYSGRIV